MADDVSMSDGDFDDDVTSVGVRESPQELLEAIDDAVSQLHRSKECFRSVENSNKHIEEKLDRDGFVVAGGNAVNSKGNQRAGYQPPVKKINPRILILDFIQAFESPIQSIENIMRNKTQITGFCMKKLPRGGISIWFRRPGQKD